MKVAIIDYGAGNIQSLQFALNRLGVQGVLTADVDQLQTADKVIFPGVGEASSAMQKLNVSGLQHLLPTLTQPVLGICLGMQLMCNSTEEGMTQGLGIFNVDVKRFSAKVKVPQMGWNTISNAKGPLFDAIDDKEYMYLVHSYFAPSCSNTIAETNYDGAYSTALQKDNFYGVQFHPEKSSKAGSQLLQNFLSI
ncbi:imidazole glycerol phosphate synthase subunit HisH [Flavobacteriaceae bacterium]|nr:imidazole glycerol phosphate synthase subunit HisH [Flavobacteriaceae bacterium]MDA9244500.1 imidazole glycerol phosphate synthase subunit HisH [Flavobacteriaceae bacterium]MDA9330447.1 imidazole glycerol phosphate synthase subunit HisH [Flavobacteriaceae bacterium]MDB4112961.1 imidazole glycerol phosphate synthase subunit HisH [Flavobacteriaceae bacterium]MDB4186286.1 imidazole glycerol phosphate synthase subunit HisH [Flavobacteriaceae bacterium]